MSNLILVASLLFCAFMASDRPGPDTAIFLVGAAIVAAMPSKKEASET